MIQHFAEKRLIQHCVHSAYLCWKLLGKVESELCWKDFPYPSSKTWLGHFLQYSKSVEIQIQCVYKVKTTMQSNSQRETQLEKQ